MYIAIQKHKISRLKSLKRSSVVFSGVLLMVKTSRPLFWGLIVIYLCGFYESGGSFSPGFCLQLFSYTFPLFLFINGVNDIFDYKSDLLNPRKMNPGSISGRVLHIKYHRSVFRAAIFSGIIVLLTSLATMSPANILSTGMLLLCCYYYSASPLRLKSRPPFDLLTNLFAFLFYYFAGYAIGNPYLRDIPLETIINVFCWGLGVIGFVTLGNMMDYDSDKKSKTTNTVVRFGLKANAIFVFLCFFSSSMIVRLEFKPLLYYIYFLTGVYATLILRPTQKYAGRLLFFTGITYAPFIGWYVYDLM